MVVGLKMEFRPLSQIQSTTNVVFEKVMTGSRVNEQPNNGMSAEEL